MTNARPEISVIIPHYNQLPLLRLCLETLERQTIDRSRYEIIVADNGEPGGVDIIKREYPDALFLSVAERGAAHARNAGMFAAQGDIFAFIDADCRASPDWLAAGLEALSSADLVGGAIKITVDNDASPSPVEAFEKVFAFRQRDYIARKRFSVTANLMASRRAAEAIGSFTNGLPEDVDWCRRGVALGFHLAFNPKSIVSHPARRNWSELTGKWDRLIAERRAGFGGKGVTGNALWMLLAAATALSTGPHLLRVATSAELSSVRDRIAAAGVLARLRFWRAWRMAQLAARE